MDSRLAVEEEIGEGIEKNEKKEIKMEILKRARAACVSEAEAATVVADVLWGSHPWNLCYLDHGTDVGYQ